MSTARDFLDEARQLLAAARSNPERLRTVACRAYYGAYHHALQNAVAAGYRFDGRTWDGKACGRHEDLIDWLETSRNDGLEELADFMRSLKLYRYRADYVLSPVPVMTDIMDVMKLANQVFDIVP